MWIPDVYQGAPTVVTLIIGSAPKFAAFGMAIRLLVDGLLPLAIDWQQMLAVLAIASLLVGNVAGVLQTNLKRMLAYSTISHMGFLFLGLLSGVVNGTVDSNAAEAAYSSAMFYIVTYVLTVLPAFGLIAMLAREGFESEEIADLAGLNQRSPLYAGVMAVCMFSLAGIPPLVGFYAKLSVLQALVASGHVADRRVLLPARGEGDVFRHAADGDHRVRAAGCPRRADRQRGAGADPGPGARRPDGIVRRCHRARAGHLTGWLPSP